MEQQNPLPQSPQQLATPMITSPKLCPHCHQVVSLTDIFCPHCGKELMEKISLSKQIWIYFVSIAGPPFGLIYFFRYIRKSEAQMRRVAWIALLLTIVSSIVTVWWGISIYTSVIQQLQQYQGLGY